MEIFADFGLFELLAVSGLAALARAIYRRPFLRWALLFVSVAAPATLLLLVTGELTRWLSALALASSLINAVALTARTPAVGIQVESDGRRPGSAPRRVTLR